MPFYRVSKHEDIAVVTKKPSLHGGQHVRSVANPRGKTVKKKKNPDGGMASHQLGHDDKIFQTCCKAIQTTVLHVLKSVSNSLSCVAL